MHVCLSVRVSVRVCMRVSVGARACVCLCKPDQSRPGSSDATPTHPPLPHILTNNDCMHPHQITGIGKKQLKNWFTNARRRIWKPLIKKQVCVCVCVGVGVGVGVGVTIKQMQTNPYTRSRGPAVHTCAHAITPPTYAQNLPCSLRMPKTPQRTA